jgi:hypothetical protein
MKLMLRSLAIALLLVVPFVTVVDQQAQAQTFYSISGTINYKYAQFPKKLVGPRTGVAPGTGVGVVDFSIPADLWKTSAYKFGVYPAYPSVAQVVATSTTSHPAPAAMAAGGGPGSLAWCPPAGNPVNPICTNPAAATAGLNGLLVYTAGLNQFGGTIDIITHTAGETSRRIATGPSQFNHVARTSTGAWLAGGSYEGSIFVQRPPGVITQSPVLGPSGSIQTPGIYVGPGPTPPSIIQTGLPLTTGMIVGRDSRPSPFTLTLSGYDNRNASGVGTIQLVGGSFFNQPAASPAQAFPGNTTIKVTLPEPTAVSGLAFGALALFGLLYRARRRGTRG